MPSTSVPPTCTYPPPHILVLPRASTRQSGEPAPHGYDLPPFASKSFLFYFSRYVLSPSCLIFFPLFPDTHLCVYKRHVLASDQYGDLRLPFTAAQR